MSDQPSEWAMERAGTLVRDFTDDASDDVKIAKALDAAREDVAREWSNAAMDWGPEAAGLDRPFTSWQEAMDLYAHRTTGEA